VAVVTVAASLAAWYRTSSWWVLRSKGLAAEVAAVVEGVADYSSTQRE